jgi:hypothetical protein
VVAATGNDNAADIATEWLCEGRERYKWVTLTADLGE